MYKKAALVLPDGMPLLWAGRFLGTPLKAKISGSDLFPKLCGSAAQEGYRVFFLGGREDAALKAADELKRISPNLKVAGVYSPPFGFEKNEVEVENIIRMINKACPDILFVGLGSPKQEKFIFRFKDRLKVPVSIGIGVSFEFIAGMVKRAPVWMQYAGLEWFWRLLMEPKRLWKRYLIDNPVFFLLILKQKLGLQCAR
jgi:N-acetylglucosaminyldiphosphoundecaprenol N-acetyl-beta-D-mannosaminyltransferase